MLFGKPKADPNATVAKNALPGTVPGSTPPVLLAATRGYYKVISHLLKMKNVIRKKNRT